MLCYEHLLQHTGRWKLFVNTDGCTICSTLVLHSVYVQYLINEYILYDFEEFGYFVLFFVLHELSIYSLVLWVVRRGLFMPVVVGGSTSCPVHHIILWSYQLNQWEEAWPYTTWNQSLRCPLVENESRAHYTLKCNICSLDQRHWPIDDFVSLLCMICFLFAELV